MNTVTNPHIRSQRRSKSGRRYHGKKALPAVVRSGRKDHRCQRAGNCRCEGNDWAGWNRLRTGFRHHRGRDQKAGCLSGYIRRHESVVAVLTGHVLKDPDYVSRYHRGTLTLEASEGSMPSQRIAGAFQNAPGKRTREQSGDSSQQWSDDDRRRRPSKGVVRVRP